MSSITKNLGLFKYDTETDAKQVFNLNVALNNNWDILDEKCVGDGFNLFDTKISDHILTGDEAIGWVLQGSLVTNTYPDAISRIKQEYNEGTNETYLEITDIVLPTFTANTTNGITVSDSRNNTNAWNLITGVNSKQIGSWDTYWFNIDYGQDVVLTQYSIKADSNSQPEYPTDWTLQASNDGSIWEIIDTQTEQVFTLGQERNFSIDNETAYNQYRLVFSNGLTSSGGGELGKLSFSAYKIDLQFNYKKHSNGHKIADISQKSELDKYYNSYGMCNFYILDSSNNQFYLPRSKYTYQITDNVNNVFDRQDAGLPNITGSFYGGLGSYTHYGDGAFYETDINAVTDRIGSQGNITKHRFGFDASRISSIYGNSNTVQPPGILYLLYYKVGNTVTNDSQIDIGNVLSDLNVIENQKADKDLSNCTKPYITEIYQNDMFGYVTYSNGFIEQWGRQAVSSRSTSVITLLKSFNNADYLALITNITGTNPTAANSNAGSLTNLTVSQMTLRQAEGNYTYCWYAAGF